MLARVSECSSPRDRPLLAARGSSTGGHLRRSAGAVKMQRPTGRTILTAPSTGTSSKPEEPRPHGGSHHQTGARWVGFGLPVGDEDLVGVFGLFDHGGLLGASLFVVVGRAG